MQGIDGTFVLADALSEPQSRPRNASSKKHLLNGNGNQSAGVSKKKKKMRENIRVAQELNSQAGYFMKQNNASHLQQVYQKVPVTMNNFSVHHGSATSNTASSTKHNSEFYMQQALKDYNRI